MMELKIQKIHPDARLPSFAYEGDAGMDLFSCEDCELEAGEIRAVSTGLRIAVPEGYAGFIWDKSGLALAGLTTLAGVLDSGYRGELKVVVANLGKRPLHIKKREKIAQLIIKKIERPKIVEAELDFDSTERGEAGFGSSGLT